MQRQTTRARRAMLIASAVVWVGACSASQSGLTLAADAPNDPFISSISPASAPFEARITITGDGFTPTGNTVNFLTKTSEPRAITAVPEARSDGGEIVFVLKRRVTLCPPGPACYDEVLEPGTYDVMVTNPQGRSNRVTFTITEK